MRILHAAYDPHAALCSACGLIALYAARPMTFVAMAQRVLMPECLRTAQFHRPVADLPSLPRHYVINI
jgi:hypothetical protein